MLNHCIYPQSVPTRESQTKEIHSTLGGYIRRPLNCPPPLGTPPVPSQRSFKIFCEKRNHELRLAEAISCYTQSTRKAPRIQGRWKIQSILESRASSAVPLTRWKLGREFLEKLPVATRCLSHPVHGNDKRSRVK